MNHEEILATLQPFETETKLSAWSFQVEKKFYQVIEYGGVFKLLPKTSVWETNKRGKRLSPTPLFTIDGKKHEECVKQFLTKIENL